MGVFLFQLLLLHSVPSLLHLLNQIKCIFLKVPQGSGLLCPLEVSFPGVYPCRLPFLSFLSSLLNTLNCLFPAPAQLNTGISVKAFGSDLCCGAFQGWQCSTLSPGKEPQSSRKATN